MILLLLAYGDNRDRPAAPVLGLSVLLVVKPLGLWLLQSGDFMGDASSRWLGSSPNSSIWRPRPALALATPVPAHRSPRFADLHP